METLTRRGWFARMAGVVAAAAAWPKDLVWPAPRPWSIYDHAKRRMAEDVAVGSHAWHCEKVTVRLVNGSVYETRTMEGVTLRNGDTLELTMSSSGEVAV